jgi:hypothetical protein
MRASWLVFLIRTGDIFVDETVFFLAEDGLKGATAARAVSAFVFRPVGISAVQITEMHNCSSLPSHLEYWSNGILECWAYRSNIWHFFAVCSRVGRKYLSVHLKASSQVSISPILQHSMWCVAPDFIREEQDESEAE